MAAHRRERGHGWFNQPGPISPASLRPPRENLLNWAYSEMGIGAVQKGNRVYVAQVFVQRWRAGRRSGAARTPL